MPHKRRFIIPLCRSPFLQDVTIALGRRSLKGIRYNNALSFDVTDENADGNVYERLAIEARHIFGLTKIVLWADGTSWIYFNSNGVLRSPEVFEKHVRLTDTDPEQVAELLRATLRDFNSTRAFWQEQPTVS